MAKYFIIAFITLTFAAFSTQAQEYKQELDGPLFYEANKGIQFNMLKFKEGQSSGFTRELSDEFKLAPSGFKFEIVSIRKSNDKDKEYNIVEISFPKLESKNSDSTQANVKTSNLYINPKDNGSIFWMKEAEFNDLKEKKFIREYRRRRYPSIAYGPSISLPFKVRPKVQNQHMKITPEVALGGYVGPKIWLSRYSDVALIPVFTLAVSALGINDNNTINETLPAGKESPDALILGITGSIGAVLQYEQFQMGFMIGKDKASGEFGKNWIYNDEKWYSFSIGFKFLK